MRRLLVPALVCLVLAGCNTGPSIVGKWSGDFPFKGTTAPANLDVRADKTYTMSMANQGLTFSVTGTWDIKDKDWTTTVTDAKIEGDLPPAAASLKPMIDQQLNGMKGEKTTAKVEFPDAKTMKMTAGGTTATLTRKE